MVNFLLSLSAFVAAVAANAIPRQFSGGPFSGSGTWFNPGLGACGISNTDADYIAAISQQLFDSFPGAGTNPNANPVCGKYVTANYNGKSVTVKIVDRCVGCAEFDLDFSPAAFSALANPNIGRIPISWSWN